VSEHGSARRFIRAIPEGNSGGPKAAPAVALPRKRGYVPRT
jgi:hypothetical protein